MNTQSNTLPERVDAPSLTQARVPATRSLLWSVRRELWENRFIYIAPVAVAGVFLLGFIFHLAHLPAEMRALSATQNKTEVLMDNFAMSSRQVVAAPYDFAAGLMMVTCILVTVFYCIDALHSERRDRSILFWKSLPVSDGTTVLAKAIVPFVILPVLASVVGAFLQLVMLVLSSIVLLLSGQSATVLWKELPVFPMALLLLYHILTAHTLWPLPIYSWLILVSGWARRAALLWATLPLVVISVLEQLLFHSWHFALMVGHRFIGNAPANVNTPGDIFPTNPMTHITPGVFLSTPALWIGLVIAAVFLLLSIRLRRSAGSI
jgi:ABC-2 type transport system permease protein